MIFHGMNRTEQNDWGTWDGAGSFERPAAVCVVRNTMKSPTMQRTKKQTARRPQRRRTKPPVQNEWLSLVKTLGQMMEERVEAESQREKTLMDRPAIVALNRAYTATLRYYTHLLGGGRNDARVQKAVSQLWQQAGTRMRKFDASLAGRLKASNSFWSQDVTWQQATIQEAWSHLNSIRVCANRMDPELRGPFSAS